LTPLVIPIESSALEDRADQAKVNDKIPLGPARSNLLLKTG
jgi:hypothetical protein